MQNFFGGKKMENPFVNIDNENGDITGTMTEQVQEKNENQNIIEEVQNEENNENTEEQVEDKIEEQQPDESEVLKLQYEDLNNKYLRLAADFDNYRKRQAQEREALLRYGAEECMKKVIEVVDNFDRAMLSLDKIEELDKMKETFIVLHRQLMDSLTKLGLEQIKCVGEKFNPNLHEAVMQTQSDEHEEDTVIKELQKGYKLGDKVLRPAMVDVAVK